MFGAAVLVLWAGAGVLLGLAHQLTLGHLGAAAGLPVFGLTGVVAAFAARLKDAVDLDSVRDDLTGVVQRTLEPAHVSVWISRRGPGVS